MSNVLAHRFVSPKLDGPDLTQVQPSAWNDGHRFAGGATGDVLMRDTSDATFGAAWRPRAVWVDRPFDPAKFSAITGSFSMASAPSLNAFTFQEHTITFALNINSATITGTPQYLICYTHDFLGPSARGHTGLFHYWCPTYAGIGYAEWSTTDPAIFLWRDIGGTAWVATGTFFIRLTLIGSIT